MVTRRVVTGIDARGAAVVTSDEVLEPLSSPGLAGTEMTYLWGSDVVPSVPNDGAMPSFRTHFPRSDGWRYVMFSLSPPNVDDGSRLVSATDQADAEDKFPGLLELLEPDMPGMHKSATVDIAVVLAGEVVMELDDGAQTTLYAGDVVVQNGTRHRWLNPGPQVVRMAFVVRGANASS